MHLQAQAPQHLSLVVRGELGLGVLLYLDLVLNRQSHSSLGMLTICHFLDHTLIVIHIHKILHHDRPKSVPTRALHAIHLGPIRLATR